MLFVVGWPVQARAVAVDDLAKEAESLTRSNHMVSEYIEHGKGMLASLQAQGATLKVRARTHVPAVLTVPLVFGVLILRTF